MIPQPLQQWQDEFTALRRDLHRHPELAFEERRTSSIVAKALRGWGYEVSDGIAGTGVVGTLRKGNGRSIGLRADMDALPILEKSGKPWASLSPGLMHACGHDGHTTTLLAAARYLAEHGHFNGTVHLIFQPAEENIGGAARMIEEGLFEKFPCDAVFALHNLPGLAQGHVLTRPGAIMAAVDIASVTIRGRGGHGAVPHLARDPIVAASALVQALQTLVARNMNPTDPAVVTVGSFQAGQIATVIPETAQLEIGIRTTSRIARDVMEERFRDLVNGTAAAHGCTAEILYDRSYPATINTREETHFLLDTLASAGFGVTHADAPIMFSEDFAVMLEKAPGCYFMLGAGDAPDTPFLHDANYDFNDALIAPGAAMFVRLVEEFLKR